MTELAAYRQRVNEKLAAVLAGEGVPERLAEAMRYAVLGGGKRVRPCLVYLAAEAAGAPPERADSVACAVELIHAYSLAHDDLPSMDDDELRRGNPTCHVQFDEATAILAGDALQARAFEIVAGDESLTPDQRLGVIRRLANAAGPTGMVGGQVIDLASEDIDIPADILIDMHNRKTGALIATSVVCGAICGIAEGELLDAMIEYGFALGLAFQVRDDILDETGEADRIGKTTGADKGKRKSTFISTYGLQASCEELDRLREHALETLTPLGSAGDRLAAMAEFIARRDH